MARNIRQDQPQTQKPRYRGSYTRNSSAYYTTDSTARQIAPQERIALPRPKQNKRRIYRRRTQFAYDVQTRHRYNLMSYLLLIVFFGALATFVYLGAQTHQSRLQLESARTQLATLQGANISLASGIYNSINLEEIEAFARNELGMVTPEEWQLVEVSVQPRSFFSHIDTANPAQNGFSFSRFWNIIFSFAGGD